ncbi:MAG: hypothetical protein Fur006_24880 [Coleofasciculaceae cyanobacterium]
MGGHNVPEETIRRRYHAGIRNFFQLYCPLADTWRFYDNSDTASPRLIATGRGNFENTVNDVRTWESLVGEYGQ